MLRAGLAVVMVSVAGPGLAAEVDGTRVAFERIGEGFSRPLAVEALPDGRLLVAEKSGTLRVLEDGAPGAVLLDIGGLVSDGGEQGLLGLALDPDFASTGQFYVNYTDLAGDTHIVRYESADGVADPRSGETILSIAQPRANHNGGWIGFGPDGMLYIGMGDGGGAGDRDGYGQNPEALLGKMLRIDPRGGAPYAIPDGNPFADGGGAPEIFLTGLRNPWRNSFDGDLLYIADVGQRAWEEVSVVDVTADAGANLGWATLEGRECYPPGTMCVQGGMLMPVHVYPTSDGCSITGGVVYRGQALPALEGRYFFADWCTGVVQSFRYEGGEAAGLVDLSAGIGSLGNVTAFGTDGDGEMIVVSDDGTLFRMVPGS